MLLCSMIRWNTLQYIVMDFQHGHRIRFTGTDAQRHVPSCPFSNQVPSNLNNMKPKFKLVTRTQNPLLTGRTDRTQAH